MRARISQVDDLKDGIDFGCGAPAHPAVFSRPVKRS